ncbi:MAG: lactate racemase domain-containing protein [bacterium]|nr:lactate racemase domain-containing protein [bacterium]
MSVRLAYGDTLIDLSVPQQVRVQEFSPKAADHPLSFEEFKDLFMRCDGVDKLSAPTLLFVVNDGHRSTPTIAILEWIDQIDTAVLDSAEFLIATGTHSHPTPAHFNSIFGQLYERVKSRVHVHDARDYDSMVKVGEDPLGGDVWIDRRFVEAERVIVISSAEPHYFAGYSGGRKSFFPGLTDLATVERNHNLANSLDCAPLKLFGNPMSEHLEQLLGMVDLEKVLSVQVVFDATGEIVNCSVGALHDSFREAAALSDAVYAHEIKDQFDIVLCEMLPPLDNSLYQAQKGVENCRAAVKPKGAIIVVSPCTDGVGSSHFFDLAAEWDPVKNCARDGRMRFGSHKLSRINALTREMTVGIHCPVDDESVRRVFYTPVSDLNAFILERTGQKADMSLALVHDAGNVVLKRPT